MAFKQQGARGGAFKIELEWLPHSCLPPILSQVALYIHVCPDLCVNKTTVMAPCIRALFQLPAAQFQQNKEFVVDCNILQIHCICLQK